LNAEVVLGTISNTKEAINWLAYTYLYVRMIRAPQIYGIELEEL
jgi:pre-mRNA-splicing helicase BRR2